MSIIVNKPSEFNVDKLNHTNHLIITKRCPHCDNQLIVEFTHKTNTDDMCNKSYKIDCPHCNNSSTIETKVSFVILPLI